MAHVIAAEELWQERLLQSGRTVVVWPEHSVAECAAIAWRIYTDYIHAVRQELFA